MLVTRVRRRTVECKVAQAGHDAGVVAGADLAVVLVEGHVADPVQLVLHRPVAADGVAEGGGAGLVGGQRGDGVGGLGAPAAGHLGCLGGVGEQEAGAHRDGLYGALRISMWSAGGGGLWLCAGMGGVEAPVLKRATSCEPRYGLAV